MGNRSCINISGNATQGQSVGVGFDVYKGKSDGITLDFKSLSVTGSTMSITCDDDNIYFSASSTGGGSTPTGTACSLAWYDTSGDLCDTNVLLDKTGKDIVFNETSSWSICGLCGDNSVNDGADLSICAGGNYASGTGTQNGGDLVLSAGDNNAGAGNGDGGNIIISPGNQCQYYHPGYIVLGKSSYNSEKITMCAAGNCSNVSVSLLQQGSGTMSIGCGNVNATYIHGSSIILANILTVSRGNSTISFRECSNGVIQGATASSTSVTGCSVTIRGGVPYNVGNNDGGDVILCGGSSNGTGDDGRIVMPTLPSKGSETCVVYIDASGNLSTGAASSDIKLKCNIEPIKSAVSLLDNICGYSAEFNDLSNCHGCCEYVFIAQEVEKDLPLAVKNGVLINDVDYKLVEYTQMIPVLWNIIKEQEVRIKALEDQINT